MPIRDREGRGKQRRVPLSDMIREEAEIAEREEMGEDRKFDPDRDLAGAFHGPNAFARTMRDKDQLVLDELLASLPKNQGYYLKLYREIMPGKFEYKEQINNYDTWTDMELEIAERVKAMTRKFGSKKWGSGLYRVVVWRQGGIREANKYPITDIIVDAGDNEDAAANIHSGKVDPIEAANEQMNSLGNMLKAVEGIMPRAVDPNLQFQSIVQAFTSGRAEKQQAEASSNQAMMTMMTTMMTSMMGLVTAVMQGNKSEAVAKPIEEQMAMMMNLMKSFGLGQAPQPKSLVEQITEMKMLGWDPTAKEDTLDQIAKLKAVTGALVDVMPSNGQAAERPGIFEKLIDSVAPHLPKIFADMKAITENTALAQQLQRTRLADAGPQPIPVDARPTTRYGQPVGPQPRMGVADAFHEPPDMDPYSGFQTRPFQDPTVSDAGIRDEMTGSVGGATPEQMRAHFTGQQVQPTPVQPTGQRDPVADQLRAQAETRHDVVQPALPPLLQQLYLLIDGDKRDAYGALYDVLSNDQQTAIMITLAQQKQVTAQQLVQQLQETGFGEFQGKLFEQKANEYLSGFVRWVIENTVGKITSRCGLCGAEHIFESKYEFMRADAPVCGVEISGTETCAGILQLVVKDQQYVAAS